MRDCANCGGPGKVYWLHPKGRTYVPLCAGCTQMTAEIFSVKAKEKVDG